MTSKYIPRSRKHAPSEEMAPPTIKVFIAVPARDDVKTGFAYDLANLVGFTTAKAPHVELAVTFTKSSLIQQGRTNLVKAALSWPGVSHILWLDSDMRFPKETLLRLLERGKDIVGCAYSTRGNPIQPITFIGDVDMPNPERFYLERHATGLQEVTGTGFGVMLVDVDVFREMEKPWFAVGYCEAVDEYEGEDMYFFTKARRNGRKVWIDCDASHSIGHLGEYEYFNEAANIFRDAMAAEEPAE